MNARLFVEQISQYSFPGVFNPYRDECALHDQDRGPEIRRTNLETLLSTVQTAGVDSVWLGRDLGYRGGRRTGIAFTDEMQLPTVESHFGIQGLRRATIGPPMKERTATVVWEIIGEVGVNVFPWNVFPFHPFELDNPMGNRRHTSKEFEHSKEILLTLLRWLKPRNIVAVGADANAAALALGFNVTKVRHPSYGGHREFALGIQKLYRQSNHAVPSSKKCVRSSGC